MYGEDRPYKEYEHKYDKNYKKEIWDTSFGLQKTDGLTPSKYLVELSKEEIEGKKNYEGIGNDLKQYYASSDNYSKEKEEADFVSVRIAEWIGHGMPVELSERRKYPYLCGICH